MLGADVLFNLCSRRDPTRKASVSLHRAASNCTLDELIKFYQQRAVKDAEWLRSEHGIRLQNTVASPAVQQGGSAATSQPNVQTSGPVGAGKKDNVRLEGTPLIAKKSSIKATTTDRPSAGVVSPIVSALGLSKGK